MNEKPRITSTTDDQVAVLLNGNTPSKLECEKMKDEKTSTESVSTEQEVPERDEWSGKLDFIMSLVSYAVGLGNIWRFPYLCYRNGGAVFLIPYLFFLIMCGMPLFLIEVSYGQFASLSPITIWHLSPLFRGVGYGMVIISGIVCIYYNVIITWTLYYLFKSFNSVLPWSTCDNDWNTWRCALKQHNGTDGNYTTNATMTTESSVMTTVATMANEFGNETLANASKVHYKSPSEEFWENHVLELSEGIEDLGGIRWELFGCLILAWVLVFLVLIKGVKSAGKVMYFTAVFPYIVLTCLLIRSCTLEGSMEGIKYYVIPQWDKLLTLRIWGEAAMQIFYSVGAAWGALITMASFNKFDHNCYRDAYIIPLLNCATSIFAGFIIFSIIGFMAHETGSSIHDVITQGPGLVFVVYPEAIAKFPLPQIWAVLFFAMLLSIGIGSQVGMFNTVTSAFIDEFDFLKSRKVLLTATVCVAEFLLGVPCVTRGGIYYLQVMDWYCATFSLMILSFCELMVIAWVYGINRFYKDMQLMLGFQPCAYWKFMWSYLTPALILFVLGFSIVIHTPVTYGVYEYPGWAVGIGWMFALASLVPVPILAIIGYRKIHSGSFVSRVKKASRPNGEWGPALDEDRLRYYQSLKAEGSDFVTEEMLSCLTRPHLVLHKAVDLNSTLNLKSNSNANLKGGSSLRDLKEHSIV